MLVAQGGVCALCGTTDAGPPNGKYVTDTVFHVDHDHETGQIRALLCKACNMGLGCFQDQPELLEQAAAYLRSYAG